MQGDQALGLTVLLKKSVGASDASDASAAGKFASSVGGAGEFVGSAGGAGEFVIHKFDRDTWMQLYCIQVVVVQMVLVNLQCAGGAGDASGADEFAINKFDMGSLMQPYNASKVAVV